jgi:hypothetical protein
MYDAAMTLVAEWLLVILNTHKVGLIVCVDTGLIMIDRVMDLLPFLESWGNLNQLRTLIHIAISEAGY